MKSLSFTVAAAIILITRNELIRADEDQRSDEASEGPVSKQLGISSYLPQYVIYQPQPQTYYIPNPVIYWSPPAAPQPQASASSTFNNLWLLVYLLRRIQNDDDSSNESEDSGPELDSFGCRTTNPFAQLFNAGTLGSIDSITNPVGRCYILNGEPISPAGQFRVDLKNTDTIYTHMDFRLNTRVISRDTHISGTWNGPVTNTFSSFPLQPGVPFEIRIIVNSNFYEVYIDDQHYFRYDFIVSAAGITEFEVLGAVTINSMTVF